MRIAINTRFLLSDKMEGFGWYTYEIVSRMVQNHPEHTFIFLFDRPYDKKFVFGKNVVPVVLSPQARHPILFKIWYGYSVKRALKKHKADLFFSPDGYLSLTSSLKQINVIHDINFEHNPQDVPNNIRRYLCKYFPLFAKKAQHIITVSEYSKKDICTTYKIDEGKVTAIWNGASDVFQPITNKEIEDQQKKYAKGQPYLLFVGALHPRKNVQRLIEAFVKLKQKDSSNPYQLVIVGTELFSNSNNGFKIPQSIKDQIFFTGHLDLEHLAKVMAGASIFTFVPYFEGFGIPLVEAMKSGTPILSGDRTSLPEVAGDAALYCNPFEVDDISAKLELLCNDSELRAELTQKGLVRSKLFSWDKAAESVWEIIDKYGLKS